MVIGIVEIHISYTVSAQLLLDQLIQIWAQFRQKVAITQWTIGQLASMELELQALEPEERARDIYEVKHLKCSFQSLIQT